MPIPPPNLPTWAAPWARVILTLALIAFGVKMWLDGFSGAAVALGVSLLAAEIAGFGVSKAQATTLAAYIADLEARALGGKPPSSQ